MKVGAKSKVLTTSLPPGGGAYSRALKSENVIIPALRCTWGSSGYK